MYDKYSCNKIVPLHPCSTSRNLFYDFYVYFNKNVLWKKNVFGKKKEYETYYRGEEELFYYKSIYHTCKYLFIFNILILDYNISIFQYIYLTLSLHLPFFIALSLCCFISLLLSILLYLFNALSLYCFISVFQYLFIQISLNSNISAFHYLCIPISLQSNISGFQYI